MKDTKHYNLFVMFMVFTLIFTSALFPNHLHIYAQNTSVSENLNNDENSPDNSSGIDDDNTELDNENPVEPEPGINEEEEDPIKSTNEDNDNLEDIEFPSSEEELPDEIFPEPMLDMDMIDSVGIDSREKLEEAIDNAPLNTPTEIVITNSFEIIGSPLNINMNKIITIKSDSNGPHTILKPTPSALNYRHFNVEGQLTLENIILLGADADNDESALGSGGIDVGTPRTGNYAVLILNNGAVIDGCHCPKASYISGGGITIRQGGKLIMNNDSVIQNCNSKSTTFGGGAVFVSKAERSHETDNGIFIMNGGSIINNRARVLGGGVFIDGVSTASDRDKYHAGEFRMYGGTITENDVYRGHGSYVAGGGVYNDGDFYMYNGTISNNTTSGNMAWHGGGVYIALSGYFEMFNGIIEQNESVRGAGVCTHNGRFIMHDGIIRENIAENQGGGVIVVGSYADFSNEPDFNNGLFEMKGGLIENNSAKTGGGVEANWGKFNMYGGTISNNYASEYGGGIRVAAVENDESVLTIDGGSIMNNTAGINGGGIYLTYTNSTLYSNATIDNANIIGNTAEKDGGGIYVGSYDQGYINFTTNENTVFWNNKAQSAYDPPDDAYNTYPNIRFAAASVLGHPLTNYDINIGGYPPYDIDNETLDLTVKVVDKKTDTAWINAQLNLYLDFNNTPIYYSLLNNSDIYWSTNKENAEVFVTDGNGEFVIKELPVGMEYNFYQHIDYRGYNPFGGSILFDKDNDFLLIEAEPISETVTPDPPPTDDKEKDPDNYEKDNDRTDSFISVIYHLNDGSSPDIYLIKNINPGSAVSPPSPPVREGYKFDGWYLERSCINEFDFSTKIYETLHLYAKWILDLPFTDEHYAYIVGYEDGTVRPLANITRAETATIFYRLLDEDFRQSVLTQYNPFSDLLPEMWHNIAVSSMNKAKVTSGYPDGTFKPTENITRAEFASIAARFANIVPETTNSPFSDISGHWAESHINLAYNLGWISGYPDNTFRPDAYITRAEVASLVNRILSRKPLSADHLHKDMIQSPDNAEKTAWYYLDIQEATNSHNYELHIQDPSYEYWIELIENFDWLSIEAPGSIKQN